MFESGTFTAARRGGQTIRSAITHMPELFLPASFMVATILVLIGLMYIFKGWMQSRDRIVDGGAPMTSKGGHGHH